MVALLSVLPFSHFVRNACGGADEVPELAEGEAVLKEALPLAEALDEVALEPGMRLVLGTKSGLRLGKGATLLQQRQHVSNNIPYKSKSIKRKDVYMSSCLANIYT